MGYPNQPWQPQVAPPAQPPQFNGAAYGPPGGYPPGYGPPPSGMNLANIDRIKVAAGVVLVSGLIVLIGTLFSLYSVTVTPSALSVRHNDAPSGHVTVDIGFYDVLPFAPPIVAEAIPVLMVLSALLVVPSLFGPPRKASATPAVLAGTATLLSIILAISGPLPSVDLDGQLAARLREKSGGQNLNSIIDSVLSVTPGAGLVMAIIFSLIGWVAAASLIFERKPRPPVPMAAGPYAVPPGYQVMPPYGPAGPPSGPVGPPQGLAGPPQGPQNQATPW